MKNNYINIIVIDKDDDTILENILIITTNPADAEQVFFEKCAEYFTNWDEYSEEDMNAILDNGYEESGHKAVYITWPDVKDKTDED